MIYNLIKKRVVPLSIISKIFYSPEGIDLYFVLSCFLLYFCFDIFFCFVENNAFISVSIFQF